MEYWAKKAKAYQTGQDPHRSYSRSGPSTLTSAKPVAATSVPPLGPLIKTFIKAELSGEASSFLKTSTISNCRLVTSYNWIDGPEPTILIPGRPPKWTPPQDTPQLAEDSGIYFRDRNAARFPKHPLEAAVLAWLSATTIGSESNTGSGKDPQPTVEIPDIVTCSSALGNLLRFVRGETKAFRISVQMVDATLFLIRRENSPRATIPDVRGYGHAFPEAYTTWEADVRGSTSHQRVMQYDFGGLTCMVRFEADGYKASSTGPLAAVGLPYGALTSGEYPLYPPTLDGTKAATIKASSKTSPASIDRLSDALTQAAVQSVPSVPSQSSKIVVKHGGRLTDQALVFDLKTRALWKKDQNVLQDELPRLWVAQIPNFVLGFHKRGKFTEIQFKPTTPHVRDWERREQNNLACLAVLIHRIIKLAQEAEGGRLELSSTGQGSLTVHRQLSDVSEVLSPEVLGMWRNVS